MFACGGTASPDVLFHILASALGTSLEDLVDLH